MQVKIRLPAPLRYCAAGQEEVTVQAATVGGALAGAVAQHPALRRHLYAEDGRLRGYVNIYLNDQDVRHLAGEATAVGAGDQVTIVPSIAGGAAGGGAGTVAESGALHPSGLRPEEVLRYSRQIVLPDVGWEGQQKLRAARILLVGAGGLGSPLGLYLAAAGVGTIGVVEFDEVDLSNLQRQVLFGVEDVGRPKLDAALERLRSLNPHIEVVPHPERLTSENAL
jgi:adenylyltransferase/sulfurtransferase